MEAIDIKQKRKNRWTEEIENLIKQKKILHLKWLNIKSTRDKKAYDNIKTKNKKNKLSKK